MAGTPSPRDPEGTVPPCQLLSTARAAWGRAEGSGAALSRLSLHPAGIPVPQTHPVTPLLLPRVLCIPFGKKFFLFLGYRRSIRRLKLGAADIPQREDPSHPCVASREAGAPSLPSSCPGPAHQLPRNDVSLLPGSAGPAGMCWGPAMGDGAASVPFPDSGARGISDGAGIPTCPQPRMQPQAGMGCETNLPFTF